MTDEPRAATIEAIEAEVLCLTLHRQTFSDLLSNVSNLLDVHRMPPRLRPTHAPSKVPSSRPAVL